MKEGLIIKNMKDIIERMEKNNKSRLRYVKNPKHKKKSKKIINKQLIERNAQKRILKRIIRKFEEVKK